MSKIINELPVEQIEIVYLHDMFSEDVLEYITLTLLQDYPDRMREVRDERLWTAAEFIRVIDGMINSDFYHIVDPSFVRIETLWTSAWRLLDNYKYGVDFYKKMDNDELQQQIEDYKALCKAKEFLLEHSECYVFNNVFSNESDAWSLRKVPAISYEHIIDDVRNWDGVFCDYVDDSYNVFLSSEELIRVIEEYIDINTYDDDDNQIIQLRKTIKILKKNPSVNVIVKDYYTPAYMFGI